MKILVLLTTVLLSSVTYSQTRGEALELYRLRGENQENSLRGAKAFEGLAATEEDKLEKCFLLNKGSYLNFFYGSQLTDEDQELIYLEKSIDLSNQCRDLLITDLDADQVNNLIDKEKDELALSLYQGGTSLARLSEIKGTTTALKNWPEIRKRMNFIIKIKKSETANYGAHRTLGIANTKMPSPFGDKKKALSYLSLSVEKTKWNGRGVSQYLFNSISLADLHFKKKDNEIGCQILQEVNSITKEELRTEVPDLYYENFVDQDRSRRLFNEMDC